MSPADPGEGVRQILRNGLFLLLAYMVPRLFTVASVVIAARWLGTEGFGVYGAAAALAVLLSVLASLGMLPLLVREIAQSQERAGPLLRTAHRLKLVSGFGMMACAWVASGAIFADQPEARSAALVLALGWVAHAFAENLAAYYQAVERMGRWTQASALFGIVSAVVGVALLLTTGSIAAYSCGFVAGWLAAFLWLWAGIPPEVRNGASASVPMARLLQGLAPFAASFIGLTLYSKIDVLLLDHLSGASEVGLYAAAYKAVDVFQALVIVVAGAVYPRLSRAALEGPGGGLAARRSLEVLLLGAVPAGLALHLAAGPIVDLLFGSAYAAGGVVLSRLALVLPLLALSLLGGYALGAAGRMASVAALYAVGFTVNVGLNLLWIPRLGAEGAALARLGSEGVLVVGFLWVLTRAGAAPAAGSLRTHALTGVSAAACVMLPDPTGGWVRAGAFLGLVAFLYAKTGVARPADLVVFRRILARRREAPVGPERTVAESIR